MRNKYLVVVENGGHSYVKSVMASSVIEACKMVASKFVSRSTVIRKVEQV